MFSTPILLIVFNRPDKAELVFNKIREIKPQKLFIAADGPRKNNQNEILKCKRVRNLLLKNINWDCEVKTLFRNENLGCKKAVSGAITWFFENVEEGIILEDDCLPNISFFYFCQEMLIKYRFDNRVMMISGNNFQFGKNRGDGSYYFSKYSSIWGWATWRRTWNNYDVDLKSFPLFRKEKIIKSIFSNKLEQLFWLNIFNNLHKGLRDTWDHQLAYIILSQNGLSITPDKNLVANIGFGKNSTRTTDSNNKIANMKTEDINRIIHPSFIIQNKEADAYTFKTIYIPMILTQISFYLQNFPKIILKKIVEYYNAIFNSKNP